MFFRLFHRHGLFIISLLQLWFVTTTDNAIIGPATTNPKSYWISPFWYQIRRSVYFVDRSAGTINRYEPVTNAYFSVKILADLTKPNAISGDSPGSDTLCVMDSRGIVTNSVAGIGIGDASSDYQRLFYVRGNEIVALAANLKQKSFALSWVVFDTVKRRASCTPVDVLAGVGYVWVACRNNGEYILDIDPGTNNTFSQIALNSTKNSPSIISLVFGGLDQSTLYATTADVKPHLVNFNNLNEAGVEGVPVVLPNHWP